MFRTVNIIMKDRKNMTDARDIEKQGQGKVWLVGAGPSDPGLFTLKGKLALEQAEVVVYDALAGQGILSMIPREARRIYVGKRSSRHTMSQESINELLVSEALAGRRVVRLKGGDPFLFGRGGEEAEALARNGIPFEIVPGITSAVAVPAYQGIPVTHRDLCSSLHIVTGHRRAGTPCDIDFEALVRAGGTMVFLMGAAALGDICRGLLEGGIKPDTPAVLLMEGTTAHQQRITATVSTLEGEARKREVRTPSLIVVGEVCALADRFAWYEKLPLAGVKVALTRPGEGMAGMALKLRNLGAEVLEAPAIRILKREPDIPLVKALQEIDTFQWLVFTSPAGVRIFFEEMRITGADIRKLGRIRIAVIGRGSAAELEKRGIFPDLVPEIYDGVHLGKALAMETGPGDRILIPRAAAGNQELVRALPGRVIEDIPIYDTVFEEECPVNWKDELEGGRTDYVMFTSASTVKGFVHAAGRMDFSAVRAICIGTQTRQAADAAGMRTWQAEKADVDSMIDCLLRAHAEEAGKETDIF